MSFIFIAKLPALIVILIIRKLSEGKLCSCIHIYIYMKIFDDTRDICRRKIRTQEKRESSRDYEISTVESCFCILLLTKKFWEKNSKFQESSFRDVRPYPV